MISLREEREDDKLKLYKCSLVTERRVDNSNEKKKDTTLPPVEGNETSKMKMGNEDGTLSNTVSDIPEVIILKTTKFENL